jgi:hypothetical protein
MSNYYSGGGTQCAKGYNPMPNDQTGQPGMSKPDPTDKTIIFSKNTAGTYVFQGSDAFFSDSNGVLVHVNLRPDNNQKSVAARTCVDGMAQFDRKPVNFSDFLPGLRSLTTDTNGQVTSFKVENIGYIYSSAPGVPAITPVNCDLSDNPNLPPTKNSQPDPTKCGTLDPSSVTSIKASNGRPAKINTIGDLFPVRPGTTDKLTIWCQDINPGSCADPLQAKNYQIRYAVTRHSGHLPSDGTTSIQYVATFTWTPTPAPAADVLQKQPL